MYNLFDLHREIAKELSDNTITESEAELLYDTMFTEQVNDLILDIYESFVDGVISADEANAFISIATEAVEGDKLSKNEKDKIDNELDNLPANERKVIEDSIKKASKEANNKTVAKVDTLNKIDKVIKNKKDKNVKESLDTLDLEMQILLEAEETGNNAKYKKILYDLNTDYKKDTISIKNAIKRLNFGEAKSLISDAKSKLDDIEKEIDGLPSEVSSTVLSLAANTVNSSIQATVGIGAILVSPTIANGGSKNISKETAAQTAKISAIGGVALGLIDTAKKAVDSKNNSNDYNLYKNNIKKAIDKNREMLDKYQTTVELCDKTVAAGKSVGTKAVSIGKDVVNRIDNSIKNSKGNKPKK